MLIIAAMKLGMFSYGSKNLFFLEIPKTGAKELKANPSFKLRFLFYVLSVLFAPLPIFLSIYK